MIQIDNDREWIQWWIEDEEWQEYEEQWRRENEPGHIDVFASAIVATSPCSEPDLIGIWRTATSPNSPERL